MMEPRQRVAIRADASSAIGTGHIFRAMAVFDAWMAQGGDCFFVCADAPGNLIELLQARGYRTIPIPNQLDQAADARAFRSAVSEAGGADTIWVDHYGLDLTWEVAARGNARMLCVVDDLANRSHDCDLLIDTSHEVDVYDRLVPAHTKRLIGLDFIPLRAEFTQSQRPIRQETARVKRILVTLGGNDPLDTSSLVLEALNHASMSSFAIDMTVGSANPRANALRECAEKMPNVTLYFQHSEMADLMARADLCIGAGGTTSWERCYMGLPTLGLVLAENQVNFMARLSRLGVAKDAGWADQLDARQLRDILQEVIEDCHWRAKASRIGQSLIDGKGVARIIARLGGQHDAA